MTIVAALGNIDKGYNHQIGWVLLQTTLESSWTQTTQKQTNLLLLPVEVDLYDGEGAEGAEERNQRSANFPHCRQLWIKTFKTIKIPTFVSFFSNIIDERMSCTYLMRELVKTESIWKHLYVFLSRILPTNMEMIMKTLFLRL